MVMRTPGGLTTNTIVCLNMFCFSHIIEKLTYYEKSFEPQLVPSKLQQRHTESRVPSASESQWSSRGTTSRAMSASESITSSMQEWYTYSVSKYISKCSKCLQRINL